MIIFIIITAKKNNNKSVSFILKPEQIDQIGNRGTKVVKIPLKDLSKFWRTLEMPLINCETNLQLTWSEKCVLVAGTVLNTVCAIICNWYKTLGPVITLSTKDNVKLFNQLESGF